MSGAVTLPGHVRDDLDALARLVVTDGRASGGGSDSATVDGIALHPDNREAIAEALYRRWYLRWTAPREQPVPTAVAFDPPRALRAAHPATVRYEGGWSVEQASSSGRAVVARDGHRRLLDRIDYLVPARPGRRAAPGDAALATARIDELDDSDGYWVTYHPDWTGGSALARVYWRVVPEAAPRLVEVLLGALEDVPHAFKAAANTDGFARGDAAVLYVDRRDWPRAAPDVAAAARALGDGLRGAPPRLVRRLAPGLGVADGASDGASFGESRCGLVADGLLAWAGRADDDLAACVAAAFDRAGLSAAQPHLDAGNHDLEWAPGGGAGASVPIRRIVGTTAAASGRSARQGDDAPTASCSDPPQGGAAAQRLLDGAVRIGDDLCDAAVWHAGRCLWLGAGSRQFGDQWRVVHESTGADLYTGTAGIGLFLAHLAGRTGSDRHLRAARGAFAHAAHEALAAAGGGRGAEDVGALGLHTGLAGIAWAAREAAARTGDAAIAELDAELTAALAARLDADGAPHASTDLIDGTAGVLLAVLAMAGARARTGAPWRDVVGRLVDRLGAAAVTQPVGVGWPGVLDDGSPPLCGLGHGASGPALALLEVAAGGAAQRRPCGARSGTSDPTGGSGDTATPAGGSGDTAAPTDPAALAAGAMAYERSWFDRTASNWPDLREYDRVALRTGKRPATPVYWCHGAAGVGLQRLRAWELTGSQPVLADLGAALQACGAQAADVMAADPDEDPWAVNVSVCHGASGIAGLLAAAGAVLDDDDLAGLARAVGAWMLDTFGGPRPWACGVAGGGETPGLMLGLSGVGMTLLQLADPAAVAPVGLAPVALGAPPRAAGGGALDTLDGPARIQRR